MLLQGYCSQQKGHLKTWVSIVILLLFQIYFISDHNFLSILVEELRRGKSETLQGWLKH